MSFELETSPITISLARRAMAVVALCVQSARVLAIVVWIALARCFLCARWAMAHASSCVLVRFSRVYWTPSEQVI